MQEEEEQKKKVFSREDIIKFYNEWKSHLHNSQYDVVAVFLLETGLRAQEFAALQNSDIDLEKNIITIKRAVGKRFVDEDGGKVEEYLKVPKNKKQRIIYLSDIAKECIADMQRRTSTYCKENKDDLLYPVFRKPYRACGYTACMASLKPGRPSTQKDRISFTPRFFRSLGIPGQNLLLSLAPAVILSISLYPSTVTPSTT